MHTGKQKQMNASYQASLVNRHIRRFIGCKKPEYVWNGLDKSAGFLIQSSPDGFGLDRIRNSPPQRILDWTGLVNVQWLSHTYLEILDGFSLT